jgi:arylsulfatase A-like enzyme
MNKKWMAAGSVLLGSLSAVLAAGQRPEKPNVLLLLTDDLGWQDVKCYDIDEPSPMETPNLDAFAKKGVQFWQAYSPAPTCAPSRCAIMSGNHPALAQKTHVVGGAPPAPHSSKYGRMMDPWYSGRMPEDTVTLANAMKQNGYATGHSGKWHIAIDHHAFPQPEDVGFDYTRSDRGAHNGMKDRLSGFATTEPQDPFRLDKNGFAFDQTNEDALTFMQDNKDKPFFLYYATWLVHAPIFTHSEELLNKYVKKLGVDPEHTNTKEIRGQLNPFYCAMVEELDYYVGQVFEYLETTEDPRWPGHMLSENTYIIFTSDNGGMEGSHERYTDNAPLSRGKISAMEGGTRVPLLIVGPGIAKGVQSDVMINGLDFYPTILGLTGSEKPAGKHLDGCDITTLLLTDPTDPTLVKQADGSVRDTMMWHFPHGGALESTIRIGDFKLVRNYDHVNNGANPELELFQLYKTQGEKQVRVDIEESKNLAALMPEKTQEMNRKLTQILTEMKASYPSYNPNYQGDLPNKEKAPAVLSLKKQGQTVEFEFRQNGADVVHADLIYTLNGGQKYEEWFRAPAKILAGSKGVAELPAGTTHCYINLIDENNFLVSYPSVTSDPKGFAKGAYSVENGGRISAPVMKAVSGGNASNSVMQKDANKDGKVTKKEYVDFFAAGFNRADKNGDQRLSAQEYTHASFKGADLDKDGQLIRAEFLAIFERQVARLDKNKDGVLSPDEQ